MHAPTATNDPGSIRSRLPALALGAISVASLALPSAAGGDEFEDAPRMLYAWDGSIATDWKETKDLVKYARHNDYDVIVFDAAAVGYDPAAAYADYLRLIQRAHQMGVQVYAMIGNPWFTVSAGARLPGQQTSSLEGWMVYENIMASGLQFDGILDNSMPYLTDYTDGVTSGNYFWDSPQLACQDYLDFLHGVRARVGELPFHHAIPFWFDIDPRLNLALEGQAGTQPLNVWVSSIVDVCNVMAYRDQALGSEGIIAFSMGELLTGPCTIGVELQDLGPELAYLTFWEEGEEYLMDQLEYVWAAVERMPNFRGFSVHNYGAVQDLGG